LLGGDNIMVRQRSELWGDVWRSQVMVKLCHSCFVPLLLHRSGTIYLLGWLSK